MENNWGVCLISPRNYLPDGEVSYSTLCDLLKATVPGFQLANEGVCVSGSHANLRAMDLSFDGGNKTQCLFAMGSYIGGYESLQAFSSNHNLLVFEKRLSLIKNPSEVSDVCKRNTVPFPYHIPNKTIDKQKLATIEEKCLRSIEGTLLLGILSGNPYKALLMEYILTGNGAKVSRDFLVRLGRLLKQYNIFVIADEVMTGGRVGPGFVMTLSQPEEFKERVRFITLGKIFGLGLTLERITNKSAATAGMAPIGASTGTSTELEKGEAYALIKAVSEHQMAGMIGEIQQKFLKIMKLDLHDTENVWGSGLLLFSSKAKNKTRTGLRQRYLPQMEKGKTLRKGSTQNSAYTSTWVNSKIMLSTELWLEAAEQLHREHWPFLSAIVDYRQTNRTLEYFSVDDVLHFLGPRTVQIVESHKKRKMETSGKTTCKTPKRILSEVLQKAVADSGGYMVQKKKTKKRIMCYILNNRSSP